MAETSTGTYRPEDQWIETFSGRRFSPAAERPNFDLEDIAHALSMTVRYNGHCNEFYSVAEHAVLVSKIVLEATKDYQLAFEALHHDDTEAYLSDVPAPFKEVLPDYKRFDRELEHKLRTYWKLPGQKSTVVKDADWVALFIEADRLLPSHGEGFIDPKGIRPTALLLKHRYQILCLQPRYAKDYYMAWHHDLMEKLSEHPK